MGEGFGQSMHSVLEEEPLTSILSRITGRGIKARAMKLAAKPSQQSGDKSARGQGLGACPAFFISTTDLRIDW